MIANRFTLPAKVIGKPSSFVMLEFDGVEPRELDCESGGSGAMPVAV